MAIIKAKGHHNYVAAYEPADGDAFVETWLTGETRRRRLLTQTIDQYQAAVDWAVKMASQMAWPLEVVPITGAEYLRRNRQQVDAAVAALDDQQRGELRRCVILTCAEVLRDCDEHEVRAEAHGVLVDLKVLPQ